MIDVLHLAGLATVQDLGRPGRMHEGLPPGGALVPEFLASANAAVRNAPGEPALEVFGVITLAVSAPLQVAADGDPPRVLRPGDRFSLACTGARVRYLAVRGGLDVPEVLGGRGTFLLGGFGGHQGRALRRGDRLLPASAPEHDTERPPRFDVDAPLRVVPGPDLDRFAPGALEVLLGGTFQISPKSDRVGARLHGPAVPLRLSGAEDGTAVSGPMVRGAIQVPPSGDPIVLGPDHPTTGGYPVIATVVRADVGALMARPVGASVRFVGSP